jgi:hypothetical protein
MEPSTIVQVTVIWELAAAWVLGIGVFVPVTRMIIALRWMTIILLLVGLWILVAIL